ncbi:mechanosensitive ion channel family protein [Melioribacteraceae bacterium 4301-Me]|uniref:mechanosensitive ion channel family protein n=1 Tax=Pyranulibacter aquaticus TaxID=3163344 RepID=UPI003598877D
MEFLNVTIWGNSIKDYLLAIGIIFLAVLIIHIIRTIVISKLKKIKNENGEIKYSFAIKSINKFLIPALYLTAMYIVIESLSFGTKADKIFTIVIYLLTTLYAVRFGIALLNYFLTKYVEKSRGEEESKRIKPLFAFLNFLIWILGLLFLLDNLGFKISTLIAGLGISGIAIGFAAQAILGDLFSYFVIFFDKPFELGDFVVFENIAGSIEKIGIKSTRIRSLSGEQITISNSKLTGTLVHNYKRMEKRRVVFNIGVTYQTKADLLKKIPSIVKEIIEKNENTLFDRAHFKSYGDFSLIYEIVYYILSSDYNVYMDVQQQINLSIFEEFEKLKIEFAYPTQTIFLNKGN